MTTEISIFNQGTANLPAHLQKYAKQAEAAAQLITGFNSLPKISLRGKQFRYMKDDKEFVYPMGAPFNCVILATDPPAGVAKAWYNEAYASDSAELPDCYSADGIKPDAMSAKSQARSCAECPKNAFGSGTDAAGNPSKGKACSDVKNLFVVEADKLDEQVSVIRVPATSLKNLSAFGRELARNNVAPQLVIAQLTFTDAEYPQLEFKATGWLSEADAAKMVARSESEEVTAALPSKNIIGSFNPDTGEVLDTPRLGIESSAPAKVELEMTDKANGMSLQKFIDSGWKEADQVSQGYAVEKTAAPEVPAPEPEVPSAPNAPAAPKAAPVKTMTAKAGETTYEQFIANKWTDETLITNGYMELT